MLCRKDFECHSERAQRAEESVYFNRFLHSAMLRIASVEMTSHPFYKAN